MIRDNLKPFFTVIGLAMAVISSIASADIMVVARNTNEVVIFDDAGSYVSTLALPAAGGSPGDIAQAPNGDIFVLRSDGTVQRFDSAGNFIESWLASGRYYGINVDDSGLVYAAGSGSDSVGVYTASGVLQTTLTPAGGSNLRDTVRMGANTWVTNFTGPKIDVLDAGGADIGDVASTDSPFGIALAPNGDAWQVAQNSHEIRRISPAGALVFSFDGDNGPNGAISSQLRYLGVGPDGNLYIPHRDSNIVDVYTDTGTHLMTLTHADLDGPDGILVTGQFQPRPTDAEPIPANSTWSLLLLLLLISGTGLLVVRRRF